MSGKRRHPDRDARFSRAGSAAVVLVVALLSCGCHELPGTLVMGSTGRALDLTSIDPAAFDEPPPAPDRATPPEPAMSPPASQPAPAEENQPTSEPASRPAYTAPSPAHQRLGLAVGVMALGVFPEVLGAGREASESVTFSSQGVIGRQGITAPPTTINNAVAGRTGSGTGGAPNVGFASPTNIFAARANPLSGPNGRCADVARAGFFGGSRAACETNFRR